VARIAKTQFPVPRFKVIAKFSQFTAKSDIEQRVLKCGFLRPVAHIVCATKPDSCGDRDAYSIKVHSRVPNRKRIEWILDWHTDAPNAERISVRSLEWIRRKRSSCHPGAIEKRARIFKVRKQYEVIIADIARKRAIVALAVRGRN